MAKKVLGNDPFKRGAAVRTEQPAGPSAPPPRPGSKPKQPARATTPEMQVGTSGLTGPTKPIPERAAKGKPKTEEVKPAATPPSPRKRPAAEATPVPRASPGVRVAPREPVPHAGAPRASPIGPGPRVHPASPAIHADPIPHAGAPTAKSLDIGPRGHAGSPRVQADPVPHAAAPTAKSLDIGPRGHAGSPRVQADPVPHADAPTAKSLDIGPRGHAGSPQVVSDPVAHAEAPTAQAVEVGTPHAGSPAVEHEPVPHADAPTLEAAIPETTAPASLGEALRGVFRAVGTAVGLSSRTAHVDTWGKDGELAASLRPLGDLLYDKYWRVQTEGLENVPNGPCILVANHAGALPLDGPVLHLALRRERPQLAGSRWLLEDQIFHAPFVGVLANRLGAVRASPENAMRILGEGRPLIVFPEGFHGLSKPFSERYQLRRFGRGGYLKIALRARVPVIPVAIVGGEESMPLLGKLPGGPFGVEYLPLTLPPLPAKWFIRFAPAIDFTGGPSDPDQDLAWIERTNLKVRDQIEEMLANQLRARQGVF